ncbi:MAG: c-type cytochrome [Gammaproteobacteria bacterium WSBS_2016_MAG_OTU1]
MNNTLNRFWRNFILRLFLVLLCWSGQAVAADISAGEEKSQPCIACHGVAGNEPIANYPILAGQLRKYLLQSLRAYKSGARADAVMSAQLQAFSDEDLQDLAAYFAAQDSNLR